VDKNSRKSDVEYKDDHDADRPHLLRLGVSEVSHALWPLALRRSIATDRAAQERRARTIRNWWLMRSRKPATKNALPAPGFFHNSELLRISLLYISLSLSLILAGACLTLLAWQPWTMVLLLSVIWAVITVLTSQLWFAYVLQSQHQYQKMLFSHPAPAPSTEIKAHEQVQSRQARAEHPSHEESVEIAAQEPAQGESLPMNSYFPATPVPATPLIRVLETIDLSSTNVEHFLEAVENEVPRSQMTMPIDEAIRRADIHIKE
jgi:hypothetical protein